MEGLAGISGPPGPEGPRVNIQTHPPLNPVVTNRLSHPYHLDESIFILRGIRSNFEILFHFSMKILLANRIAPDGTPRLAASHLGLFCLPMSHKKDARLIWVKIIYKMNTCQWFYKL